MNRISLLHVRIILAVMAAAAAPGIGQAAPASTPPPFAWPYNPSTHYMTAGLDLDPAANDRADWTGWRSGEATGGNGHAYDNHGGSDLGMPTGTVLTAPAAGTVNSLRESVPNDDHSDTGNYLTLNHANVGGQAYRTLYWHLQQNGVIPASTGVSVSKSQQIAYSDNTGNSTGPHLHYEVQLSGRPSTCPFYHGWWESDEFYSLDGRPCLVYINVTPSSILNCRDSNSASGNLLTSFPAGAKVVATQQNSWWRVFMPLPPARAVEARTAAGGLTTGYTEAGTWANSTSKTTAGEPQDDANRTPLAGSGSRSSSFGATGDAADTATFNFTAPFHRGNYDIYAAWPSDANAANVTYRVTDTNGVQNVVINQTPAATGGAGTGSKTDPYQIRTNPYVANHTTVGAPSQWANYSPFSGVNMGGPERLYRFDLTAATKVTIDVTHAGYPDKDVDIQLLTSAASTACIARADFTLTSQLNPGTYYIAVDTYQSSTRATNFTLRVEFDGPQSWANSWVKLGTFFYGAGAAGSVQVREASVTGRVDTNLPAKLCVDAIKIVPRMTRRTGWISNSSSLSSRINMATNPVPSVVIKTDKTATGDSRLMDEYVEVPIYASSAPGTTNTSAIVGKGVTGQRFVALARTGDWYNVQLSNATAATTGWILGDHLVGYRQNLVPAQVQDWSLY